MECKKYTKSLINQVKNIGCVSSLFFKEYKKTIIIHHSF